MQAHEDVLTGSAERILAMAERSHAAEIEARNLPIRAEARSFTIATIGVTFFPWLAILAAMGLVLGGEPAAGVIAGVIGVAGAGPQIIGATRRSRATPQVRRQTEEPTGDKKPKKK